MRTQSPQTEDLLVHMLNEIYLMIKSLKRVKCRRWHLVTKYTAQEWYKIPHALGKCPTEYDRSTKHDCTKLNFSNSQLFCGILYSAYFKFKLNGPVVVVLLVGIIMKTSV